MFDELAVRNNLSDAASCTLPAAATPAVVYAWDAENRLVEVVTREDLRANPSGPDDGDAKVEFAYDYMSRRVRKIHSAYQSSAWVVQSDLKFIHDKWNVVLVLDGQASDAITRKYTCVNTGTGLETPLRMPVTCSLDL